MNKQLQGALDALNMGFKVFPVKPNQKTPAVNNWQSWALNSSPEAVKAYASRVPNSNWGLFASGSNRAVLDVDNKPENNKPGKANLSKLIKKYGKLPKTYTVVTPSNGYHLYYMDDNIKNSASKIAPGIDTRGKGGYTLAPGSQINGKYYTPLNGCKDISPFPVWVKSLLQETKAKTQEAHKPIDGNIIIPEGERNQTLASLAGAMRSYGADHKLLIQTLLEYNLNHVTPPLPESEIKQIAHSIAKYEPSAAKIAVEFDDTKQTKTLISQEGWVNMEINDIEKRHWLMNGRYTIGHTSVLISPGGVGKSLLTMLDALAISTGLTKLTGFNVPAKANVWIYNTEDPIDELRRRAHALHKFYNIPHNDPDNGQVFISSGREQRLNLAKIHKGGIIQNSKLINAMIENIKLNNIKLLLIDPLAMAHECNENDNVQMTKVLEILNYIAQQADCAIGLVHHARKPGSQKAQDLDANSARGASAVINSARIAHTLRAMTNAEAQKFGIEGSKRFYYVRLDSAKSNLEKPAESAKWFKKESVLLDNGDEVGVLNAIDLALIQRATKKDLDGDPTQHEKNVSFNKARTALLYYLPHLIEQEEAITLGELSNRIEQDDLSAEIYPGRASLESKKTKLKQLLTSATTGQNNIEYAGEDKEPLHFKILGGAARGATTRIKRLKTAQVVDILEEK